MHPGGSEEGGGGGGGGGEGKRRGGGGGGGRGKKFKDFWGWEEKPTTRKEMGAHTTP